MHGPNRSSDDVGLWSRPMSLAGNRFTQGDSPASAVARFRRRHASRHVRLVGTARIATCSTPCRAGRRGDPTTMPLPPSPRCGPRQRFVQARTELRCVGGEVAVESMLTVEETRPVGEPRREEISSASRGATAAVAAASAAHRIAATRAGATFRTGELPACASRAGALVRAPLPAFRPSSRSSRRWSGTRIVGDLPRLLSTPIDDEYAATRSPESHRRLPGGRATTSS